MPLRILGLSNAGAGWDPGGDWSEVTIPALATPTPAQHRTVGWWWKQLVFKEMLCRETRDLEFYVFFFFFKFFPDVLHKGTSLTEVECRTGGFDDHMQNT